MDKGTARGTAKSRRPELCPGLLLLSCLLASVVVYSPNSYVYLGYVNHPDLVGLFMQGMAYASVAGGVALAVWCIARPRQRYFNDAVSTGASAAYAIANSTLAVVLIVGDPGLAQLSRALGIVSGISLIPVVLSWTRCFPADLRSTMLHGGLICALSTLISWGASYLSAPFGHAFMGILSVVGAVAPLLQGGIERHRVRDRMAAAAVETAGEAADDEQTGQDEQLCQDDQLGQSDQQAEQPTASVSNSLRNLLSVVWLPLVGFLILTFITNAFTIPPEVVPVSTETTGALLGSAIAIAVCLIPLSAPLALTVENLVVPCLISFCVLCASFPQDTPMFFIGAATAFAPLVFMSIYAVSSFVAVSKAGEFSASFVLGVALSTGSLAAVLGANLSASTTVGPDMGSSMQTLLAAFWVLVIVTLCISAWRRSCEADHARVPIESAAGAGKGSDGSAAEPEAIETFFSQRIDAMAKAYHLTERETEILGFLARGHNSTYIARSLFISSNTVRTHIYNLYRKLDVTNRDELLALVQKAG